MTTAIVQLNVSLQTAPSQSNQQKLGAFVSQGATTLAVNGKQLLTSVGSLASILTGALAITSMTWSGSVVTVTTAPHGIPNAATDTLTIAGVTPAGYNGTYLCTSTGANTFTFPLAGNPGAVTVQGVYTPEDVAELVAMNATFWAEGSQQSVYVLELGIGSTAAGVTALAAYITANTVNGLGPFYAYLFPRTWSAEATLSAFLNGFVNPASKTYFFCTATTGNYTNFLVTQKCAFVFIEPAGIPATEFSCAAPFFIFLNYNPSSTNKITPSRYAYLFGVTQYPIPSNQALIDTLLAAKVNIALTGAEGGLSNIILRNGTMMDGRDMTYWYAVDWVQINIDRSLSAAIINGSNNSLNPLYYNQDGINRLESVISGVLGQGVSYGMVLFPPQQLQLDPSVFTQNLNAGKYAGSSPVNAQPFIAYSVANPNDFAAGIYNGFAVSFSPNRGFSTITVNLNVTDFVVTG
jgi:hypothetical protein